MNAEESLAKSLDEPDILRLINNKSVQQGAPNIYERLKYPLNRQLKNQMEV